MTAEDGCDADVDAVVDGWQEQLLDLTRRNALVDFTPTKSKSLPLAASVTPVVDRLRETGAVELAKAPTDSPPEAARTDPTAVRETADADAVVAAREPETATESLESIERYHRQYLRERGADTLFLSIGRLTWTATGDPDPHVSPLFLLPVALEHRPETAEDVHAHGVAYDGAPLVVNPALRQKLQAERDLDLPADADVAVDDLDAAAVAHPPSGRERTAVTAASSAAEESGSHPVQSDGGDPFDTYEPPTVPEFDGDDAGVPPHEVKRALLSVVADAGPLPEATAYRTVADALDANRLDADLRKRLANEAQTVADDGHLHVHDGFLWPPRDAADIPVREHADARRQVDEIPFAELAKACHVLIVNGSAMTRSDLVLETVRRFGYERVGARIEERLDDAIDHLLEIEAAKADGERIEATHNVDVDAAFESAVYR